MKVRVGGDSANNLAYVGQVLENRVKKVDWEKATRQIKNEKLRDRFRVLKIVEGKLKATIQCFLGFKAVLSFQWVALYVIFYGLKKCYSNLERTVGTRDTYRILGYFRRNGKVYQNCRILAIALRNVA